MNLKENAFLWLLTGAGVIALALALVADRKSGGLFVAVRVVVCFASAYAGVNAYRAKKEVWTWLLGANAALYNPFVLVRLTRDLWSVVDLADIALLLTAAVVLRPRAERSAPASSPIPSLPPLPTGEPGGATSPSAGAPAKEKTYRSPSRTEKVIWLTLLFLCLAGAFMSEYYDYVSGATHNDAQNRSAGYWMLGPAFWAYIIARLGHWRRPRRIALVTLAASVATLFAASATGGFVVGTDRKDAVAAIGRFDPALAARLKGAERNSEASVSTLMRASLTRALGRAPDQAVVAFTEERFAVMQSDQELALKRCASAFSGAGDIQLNSHEQDRMLRALGKLFDAAASEPRAEVSDVEREAAAATLVAVYKRIDPDGVLDDEEGRKALSESQQCAMYTRLMNEFKGSAAQRRSRRHQSYDV
jgi:hypothetical protein